MSGQRRASDAPMRFRLCTYPGDNLYNYLERYVPGAPRRRRVEALIEQGLAVTLTAAWPTAAMLDAKNSLFEQINRLEFLAHPANHDVHTTGMPRNSVGGEEGEEPPLRPIEISAEAIASVLD